MSQRFSVRRDTDRQGHAGAVLEVGTTGRSVFIRGKGLETIADALVDIAEELRAEQHQRWLRNHGQGADDA